MQAEHDFPSTDTPTGSQESASWVCTKSKTMTSVVEMPCRPPGAGWWHKLSMWIRSFPSTALTFQYTSLKITEAGACGDRLLSPAMTMGQNQSVLQNSRGWLVSLLKGKSLSLDRDLWGKQWAIQQRASFFFFWHRTGWIVVHFRQL